MKTGFFIAGIGFVLGLLSLVLNLQSCLILCLYLLAQEPQDRPLWQWKSSLELAFKIADAFGVAIGEVFDYEVEGPK